MYKCLFLFPPFLSFLPARADAPTTIAKSCCCCRRKTPPHHRVVFTITTTHSGGQIVAMGVRVKVVGFNFPRLAGQPPQTAEGGVVVRACVHVKLCVCMCVCEMMKARIAF